MCSLTSYPLRMDLNLLYNQTLLCMLTLVPKLICQINVLDDSFHTASLEDPTLEVELEQEKETKKVRQPKNLEL